MVAVMFFAVNEKKMGGGLVIIELMNIRKDVKNWWTLSS